MTTSTYTYLSSATFGVSYVDPLGGPISGGTALLVLGSGFERLGSSARAINDTRLSDGLHCLFGADPASSNRTTRTAASLVSSSRLLCLSPRFDGALAYHRRAVPFAVTTNGDDAAAILC